MQSTDSYSDHQLLTVAEAYFREHKSIFQISQMMNLSRPLVARIIEEAQRQGVVKIQISLRERPLYLDEIERKLRKRFGLQGAVVIQGHKDILNAKKPNQNTQDVLVELAEAAGTYFSRQLLDGQTVVVGAGSLLADTIKRVHPPRQISNLKIVPMSGFMGAHSSSTSATANCRSLSQILKGQSLELPCPALVRSDVRSEIWLRATVGLQSLGFDSEHIDAIKKVFHEAILKDLAKVIKSRLQDQSLNEQQLGYVREAVEGSLSIREIVRQLPIVKETLAASELADVVMTGIGPINASKIKELKKFGVFSNYQELHNFREEVKANPPVGEICGWLFDKQGRDVDSTWRTIGIELEPIRRGVQMGKMRVIAVAGADKMRFQAILGALRGEFITDLVTDAVTAQEILRLDDPKSQM